MPLFDRLIGAPDTDALKARGDVDGLLRALTHKEPYIRWSAAAALGDMAVNIHNPGRITRALETLGKMASEALENKTARYNAIRAVGQIGECPLEAPQITRAVAMLKETMLDPDSDLRLASVEAFVRIGFGLKDSDSIRWVIDPLVQALDEANGKVREMVVRALVEIGTVAQPPLLMALRYSNFRLREGAAECLSEIGWRPGKDEDGAAYWVSRSRWAPCIEIGAAAVLPLINALNFQNVLIRDSAAQALGQIGEVVISPLQGVLVHPEKDVRLAAASALDVTGWKPDKDEMGANFAIARQSWQDCVGLGVIAVHPLLAMLKDNDVGVRRGCVWALGQIGMELKDKGLLSALLTAVVGVGTGSEERLRHAAAEALGRAGLALKDNSQRTKQVINPLLNMLRDASAEVRTAAVDALVALGWQPDRGQNGAYNWLARQDWKACVALGKVALSPLLALLEDKQRSTREGCAKCLDQLGWKADKGRSGAAYWVVKANWSACVAIGDEAVLPLIAALRRGDAALVNTPSPGSENSVPSPVSPAKTAIKGPISSKKTDGRLAAAQTAGGSLGKPATSTPIAAPSAKDSTLSVLNPAGALGSVGAHTRSTALQSQVVNALGDALRDDEVRPAAVQALGQIGRACQKPKAIVDALVAALKYEDTCPVVSAELVKLGSASVERLIEALQDHYLQKTAEEVLAQVGQPAVQALVAALKKEDMGEAAADVLERMKWKPSNDEAGVSFWIVRRNWDQVVDLGPVAVPQLLNILSESTGEMRQAAAGALGDIGDSSTIPYLTAALRDRSYGVRRKAAGALDKLKWTAENNETGAAYYITKRDWEKCVSLGEAAVPLLIIALDDSDEPVRLAAAASLGHIGDPRAVTPLSEALRSRGMRDAASHALREIARKKPV